MNRAEKIYSKVAAEHLPDAIVLTGDDVRFYATGFYSTDGCVVIERGKCLVYLDDRYSEAAKAFFAGKAGYEVRPLEPVKKILKPYKRIALPLERITLKDYLEIRENKEVADCTNALEQAMAIKDPDELEKIEKACRITDDAYLKLLPKIKEGMSENEVAALLEFLMRLGGASGPSFDTIVCFGEGSSVPHHETSQRRLKFGDIVLIDFGCKWEGYCSDCTRTFLFGDDGQHAIFKSMYQRVLEAHNLVKQFVTAGMSGRAADAVARNYFHKYNLDKLFTHSLGHGIGVNIHEKPTLSPRGSYKDFLENGMVFSDEPGLYLEGEFGIRIEDSVVLEHGRLRSLSRTDKSLIIL